MKTGGGPGDVVPAHIAESWIRARERKIDPYLIPASAYLEEDAYEKRKADNQYFVSIAKPFMENIYRYLEQSSYLVVLYDRDGYHLLRIGQRADFERGYQLDIREGLCFDETVLGTTGFSLVKRHRRPIQIIGCEHYTALLHHVVGYYAPINDPIRNELIGVIGVTTARTIPNPHTMALAVAAATAIEHSLRLDHGRKTFLFYWKTLQATMDSLSDGVFLIDLNGRFLEVNASAREIFGLGDSDIQGKHVSSVLGAPDLETLIADVLLQQDREGTEVDVEVRDQVYLSSIKYARGDMEQIQGVMVQLKNVKRLSKVIQHIAGDQQKYTSGFMIASSPKMQGIRGIARRAAESDANIIIEGESGTGKEVLAHMVHLASPRAGQDLVVINCAAIPSELMESTLFGHEKGSFTGALHTHIGKFELADRGTVFLDEIGEMPLSMQAKLLRVLEESTIERVGGKRPIKIDIRVIVATNRDLREEVRLGRFRGDLFYRLNVFLVQLPPLRERKEEIRELVPLFIGQMSNVFNKVIDDVAEDYYEALLEYNWPGNIRELRNAVKYSLTFLDGTVLRARHLAGFFTRGGPTFRNEDPLRLEMPVASARLFDVEAMAIRKSLEVANGNKAKAAKLLGIGRATLYRKLKDL
ncbi:sigma-54-dependent Fis family transcriptional regulator, partial [Candidatus Deferrimicrobium sp.]|uniref:sigma-54-dependent Fis family transcriptional regulator n=1 Tax=Candidatus Deferrimicrobium sp. TaxID=3060586 RepID=UPI003C49B381